MDKVAELKGEVPKLVDKVPEFAGEVIRPVNEVGEFEDQVIGLRRRGRRALKRGHLTRRRGPRRREPVRKTSGRGRDLSQQGDFAEKRTPFRIFSAEITLKVQDMLVQFRVSNHRSIRDEQELTLTTSGPRSDTPSAPKKLLGASIVRVAGLYGANASGKSNVLEALRFMRNAVARSHRFWKPDGGVPREPFLLDASSRKRDSEYEVDFLIEDVPYTYGFRVDSERVTGEWLYRYPHGRRQVLFRRDNASKYSFGKNLKGPNREIASLTRDNSLYLSAAAQNNHKQIQPVFNWITRNIDFVSPVNTHLGVSFGQMRFVEDPRTRAQVLTLLRASDLGITGIKVQEEALDDKVAAAMEAMVKVFQEVDGGSAPPNVQVDKSQRTVSLVHQSADHPSGVPLSLDAESTGTKVMLYMATPLLGALGEGGVLCIDELHSSLHSRIAREIVALFQDPDRNPKNAQLIFNTHDTNLLGDVGYEGSLLHRDQVWFTEKDAVGATKVYPLTDFNPRKNENLERGYLQGRYGAIPFLEPWGIPGISVATDPGEGELPQLRLEFEKRDDG